MNQVILIHGRPDKEEYFDDTMPKPHEAHWFPWLKTELEERGIKTFIPIMPQPYEPDYEEWGKVFETYKITPETMLVGHSRGGGFLLRYLSEHNISVAGFIMVAPSILPNPGVVTGFSEYEIDKSIVNRIPKISLFYSLDDEEGIVKSVEKIKEFLPNITYREFPDKGHFTRGDLGTEAFPELLDEILK
jgi:predicted alpha/beta hydrolase family esterase